MSSEGAKALVERIYQLAGKDLAHAVGLYTYFITYYYYYDANEPKLFADARANATATLSAAFSSDVAQKVMADADSVLRELEGRRVSLSYSDAQGIVTAIYKNYIAPHIKDESLGRLGSAAVTDRKVLAAASAAIITYRNLLMSSYDAAIIVKVTQLPQLVSAALGSDVGDVRPLFYKNLLGVQLDASLPYSGRQGRALAIFPDVLDRVESLAVEAASLVQAPKREEVKLTLQNLFKDKAKLKASVLNSLLYASVSTPDNLFYTSDLQFLSYFYGYGPLVERLCRDADVEGLVRNCVVNPLVYDYLKQDFRSIRSSERWRISEKIAEVLDRAGYKVVSRDEGVYVFKKDDTLVYVYAEALATSNPPHAYGKQGEKVVEIVVEAAVPNKPALSQYASYVAGSLINVSARDALWTFLDEEANTLYVLGPTYRPSVHLDVLKALAASFKVEFLGPAPEEALQAIQRAKVPAQQPQPAQASTAAAAAPPAAPQAPAAATTVQAPAAPPRPPACSPDRFKVRRGRDILEDVVAAVLEDLGFTVEVDKQVATKAGTSIEIDVWGAKAIGDSRFYVYASCKNFDRPVDVSVVREEGGRVGVMLNIPHVRILVVSSIQDTAKKEALANGFVVVEVGKKVDESNAEEACKLIYNRLNAVFVGMAPAWLQELANLADELRGAADRLIRLLQQAAR